MPSSAGDAELVALCRDGDESAWAELVERFSHYVYAIAKRGLRLSEADAEDVFQEVFARLFERLDDLRDDTAVRPYIAQVTRRVALDRHRAMAKVEPRENPPEPAPLNGDLLERLDEAMEVREALAMLPERCQEILDRFFVRDESYLMIAEALTFRPAPSRVGSLAAWEDFVARWSRGLHRPHHRSRERADGSLPMPSTSTTSSNRSRRKRWFVGARLSTASWLGSTPGLSSRRWRIKFDCSSAGAHLDTEPQIG